MSRAFGARVAIGGEATLGEDLGFFFFGVHHICQQIEHFLSFIFLTLCQELLDCRFTFMAARMDDVVSFKTLSIQVGNVCGTNGVVS